MTTEPRPPRRGARLRTSPLELRLYMAALLAAVYTISWRAIGGHASATAPPIATAPPPPPSEPPRFIWIDSLPPDLRPAVALPPGWQRAPEPRAAASAFSTQPARAVHVPSRGAPRVRTRSS